MYKMREAIIICIVILLVAGLFFYNQPVSGIMLVALLGVILIVLAILLTIRAGEKRQTKTPQVIEKYKNLSVEQILFHRKINALAKATLLEKFYGYSFDDTAPLIEAVNNQEKRLRFRLISRHKMTPEEISRCQNVSVDEHLSTLYEKTRLEVWKRDAGKCTQCASLEMLRFKHIIPRRMGGTDEARNLVLICEKCAQAKKLT
jgi:hypothetical protein